MMVSKSTQNRSRSKMRAICRTDSVLPVPGAPWNTGFSVHHVVETPQISYFFIMMDFKKMEDGFRMILEGMGEDPNREGLIDTPKRVAKMYAELMTGLSGEIKAEDILKTRFHEKYDEMIVVPNIEFASMCEHHFLPFTGRAHVAYIPGDCVVGLSKIPRVVEFYARFPQIQERMTRQIAELIQKVLQPRGVAVVLEASHMCMTMRGVKKPGASMVTTQLLGRFKTDEKTRAEFMAYIKPYIHR